MIETTDIGNYRHQVSIVSVSNSPPNANGIRTPAYTTVCTTYAKIEGISSREVEWAKSFNAQTTHKVTMRWRAGIDHTMQVRFGSRTFLITGILNPEERNVRLELLCMEIN